MKLAVELDGSQNYEEPGLKKDAARTQFLEKYGISVMRIPNNEVNRNFEGVCQAIDFRIRHSLGTEE